MQGSWEGFGTSGEALIMAAATLVPRSEAQTPQHLRQGHRGTVRYLESSHTPFPQYGDALALDRSKGHARDRRGRGTFVGPPANSVPGCGPRLRFILGPFISAGSDERGPGEGR